MEAAGLTDLLKQEGDFTLYAPSDMAFAGLSKSDLDLLKSMSFRLPPSVWVADIYRLDQLTIYVLLMFAAFFSEDVQALRTILLYHFTNGIFIGDGLEPRVINLFKSMQGSNLKVTSVSIYHSKTEYIYLVIQAFII